MDILKTGCSTRSCVYKDYGKLLSAGTIILQMLSRTQFDKVLIGVLGPFINMRLCLYFHRSLFSLDKTDFPGPTQDVPEGALPTNTPGSSPGLTGVFLTVGPDRTSPSNVPPRITKYPDSGHTPQPDQNPPHGLIDMKLLIILLVLILLIVLFAVASYAAHFAKHIQGGRPVCCMGGPRVPK